MKNCRGEKRRGEWGDYRAMFCLLERESEGRSKDDSTGRVLCDFDLDTYMQKIRKMVL